MQDELHLRAQRDLVDFLRTDLNLCSTMLDTASITSDQEHFEGALRHVTSGIVSMRDFLNRVEDPNEWQTIKADLDALERRMLGMRRKP